MSDSTRKNSMHRERTIASINATAAETPTQQSLSPSLASVKSYDSTIMQSNLDDQQQQPASQAQAGSSKRASRIKSTSNSKIHKDNDEKKNALNATKMSSSSLRGQLPLPTPLDVSECPLFCCFYAEFDIKVGPKICFQSPQGFMEQDMEVSIGKIHNVLQSSFQSIQKQEGEGTSNREQQQQPDADTSSQAEILVSPEPNECKDGALSIFDSCTEYIITGHELTGNLLNLSSHQMHILTRPTILHDERYERNSLLFCVGFVLRRAGDPRLFRPILSKWALTLRDLELETHYLSTQATRLQLQGQLNRMLVSLNSAARECFLYLTPAHVLSLRLFHPPRPPPEPVPNHVVPVLLRRDWQFQMYDWDLAINWCICHIDGVTTVLQISKIAEVDLEMVRACLRVLKHHGFVTLIDMFFFSNRYETVPSATRMLSQHDDKVLTEAVAFCLRGQTNPSGSQENSPSFHAVGSPNDSSNRSLLGTSLRLQLATSATTTTSDVFLQRVQRREDFIKVRTAIAELYLACSRSESLGDLWLAILAGNRLRHVPLNWRKIFSLIDHRRFATFGVVHGLLQRIHNFPMYRGDPVPSPWSATGGATYTQGFIPPALPPPPPSFFGGPDRFVRHASTDSRQSAAAMQVQPHKVAALMDGKHCDDALACEFGKPLDELIEIVGKQNVVSLYAPAREQA